jgi:hypothetical protein
MEKRLHRLRPRWPSSCLASNGAGHGLHPYCSSSLHPYLPPILFGMRLAHGTCAPSLLAREGGIGETLEIEATPAFTPTRTLPRRGGGDEKPTLERRRGGPRRTVVIRSQTERMGRLRFVNLIRCNPSQLRLPWHHLSVQPLAALALPPEEGGEGGLDASAGGSPHSTPLPAGEGTLKGIFPPTPNSDRRK